MNLRRSCRSTRPRLRFALVSWIAICALPVAPGAHQSVYAPRDLNPAWHNLQDFEVVGMTRWLDNRFPIQTVSSQTEHADLRFRTQSPSVRIGFKAWEISRLHRSKRPLETRLS